MVSRIQSAIRAACLAIVEAKDQLNHLDAVAGDGDCGNTLASGAQGIFL